VEVSVIVLLVVFGVLGGFISGLLGVGGGIVFVPVLSSVLLSIGLDDPDLAKYILANSFAATFFAGAISSYKQYKMNSFYPKQILLTAMLAIPTSLGISYLIAHGTWYNKESFSIFFIVLLVFMLIRFIMSRKQIEEGDTSIKVYKFPITGALTGIISALSGLGGGVIMVPLFTQFAKLNIQKAAAISIGVIPPLMVPMIIYYSTLSPSQTFSTYQIGYLIPEVFLPLVAGLLFTAPAGVSVGKKVPSKYLKIIFALLIIIVIIKTAANLV